jgi:hypothetical protein
MADDPTCGQGLAEHSVLPAKLAELTAALAENLEVHVTALDRTDENAAREHGIYLELVEKHRKIAALLDATAEEMAASRDMPMGGMTQRRWHPPLSSRPSSASSS